LTADEPRLHSAGSVLLGRHTFDARGDVATTTEAYYASDGPQRVTSFQYDVPGSLGYDDAGRLKAIPWLVNSITYDATGRPLT